MCDEPTGHILTHAPVSHMCQRLVLLQQMQPLILIQTTRLQHQGKVLNVAQ